MRELLANDTIPPRMLLDGNEHDTAYLYGTYHERGLRILDDVNGEPRCMDEAGLEVTGYVDTRLPGNYLLTYNVADNAGNKAATVTRTVHVVENAAAFLSGHYNVVCSCTAVPVGNGSATITADSYTAPITPGDYNRQFELGALRIGPERISSTCALVGSSIELGCFNVDYAISYASGTVAATKNTFTIDTKFYKYNPTVIYTCKNVFNKQVIVEVKQDEKKK